MVTGYVLWWCKYRVFQHFPRFWKMSWWRNIPYRLKCLVYPTFNFGVQYYERWDMMKPIAERFLRATRYFYRGFQTTASSETGEQTDEDGSPLDHEFATAFQMDNIRKMRFAFFYSRFIGEFEFVGMINSHEDLRNCYLWAKKKYWWAADILTWKLFQAIHEDEGKLLSKYRADYEDGMLVFARNFESLWS